ncbi:TcpQ domain-containing protein [Pseudoalteromonas denitrificans]|uniref:Toxin co-regulated pilus biosynthesis protein Q n=1 Tax=Pseudoalteromonas denitrificans DSM 6059 TaxID=1123010 RepID=A0A1I1E5H2_9GAMM|nr:TcpQ domain-containing protein [Pseudoalteromonas denitrificans]SFB81916.1 Toxin co-regulated pilus biosynthesis protein Q [Pseudoalteromonas denitrificans DSM 6059]
MWFWIKHLSLAIILIAAAAYFLLADGPLYTPSKEKKSNAAADGLSSFYASIRGSLDRVSAGSDFVKDIKMPTTKLTTALKERAEIVRPSTAKWRGTVQSRRFESGKMLKSIMNQYAKDEGIAFYWYLNKDYKVKHNFRVENNFVATLYQVGKAIDSDFEYDVKTFFCYKHRAAVITEKPSLFVRENCIKATM